MREEGGAVWQSAVHWVDLEWLSDSESPMPHLQLLQEQSKYTVYLECLCILGELETLANKLMPHKHLQQKASVSWTHQKCIVCSFAFY